MRQVGRGGDSVASARARARRATARPHRSGVRSPLPRRTTGPKSQRPILQRLVRSGGHGRAGCAHGYRPGRPYRMAARGVRGDPGAGGRRNGGRGCAGDDFHLRESSKAKRLTGQIRIFSHEASASVADLEQAIRRDLADAIIVRDERTRSSTARPWIANDSATAANVQGFVTKLAAPTAPSAEATYADYAGFSCGARGRDPQQRARAKCRAVIGVASYTHAASRLSGGERRVRFRSAHAPVNGVHGKLELHSGRIGDSACAERKHLSRGWDRTAAV